MSSSPLTMALLGLQGQGAIVDPATLAARQRLGLGNEMIQSGLDSSPAYPMQGLSRLAQALAGSILMRNGQEDLTNIGLDQRNSANAAMDAMSGIGRPAATPVGPAPVVPQMTPTAAIPPEALKPIIDTAASQTGIPAPLANAMFKQESNFGQDPKANGNIGQVIASTASNPGFGMNPISPQELQDPAKNVGFSLNYLKARGEAAGVKDWNDPKQWEIALKAYNGGGDPNYVQNVARHLPPGVQMAQAGNVASDATAPQQMAQASGQQPAVQPSVQQGTAQTGMNSPMVKEAMGDIQRAQQALRSIDPRSPYYPQVKAQAELTIEQAKLKMGLDTFATNSDGTQTNVRTGQRSSAAAPNANYVPTQTGSIDTTGTHPPTFMPSPRIYQTPAGEVGSVGPGNVPQIISPANNPGVAARKSAETQGSETGKSAGLNVGKMVDVGREADQAIGNIDYGVNQLHQAAQGGINSGYFAPWLATAAAAGKSLGVDINQLGINPAAVGNVQSAQKTLGVVAGTILQNTIGKDSQITDAKIEHFIHTQPGIETDPQAIERIMNWARSQFMFNRNMAMDAMQNTNPDTGMLSPGWRANYHAKNGFAPIYDPLSQEMKQPAPGEGPAAEMPKAPQPSQQQPAQNATPSRADVEAEMRRRGLIK